MSIIKKVILVTILVLSIAIIASPRSVCEDMCMMGVRAIISSDLADGKSEAEATQHAADFYSCCMDACGNSHPALCQ